MEVITTPDPRLRQKSVRVHFDDPENAEIIEKMRENTTSWEQEHPHELTAAMAAPQLGFNKRIILVRDDFDDKENHHFTALLNPEIIRTEGSIEADFEGCLSVPRYYGKVPRKSKVKIKAELEDGKEVRIRADGFLARTLQHEIDHLDGVLFIDHIRNNPDAWYFIDDADGELKPVENYDSEIKNNSELFPDE